MRLSLPFLKEYIPMVLCTKIFEQRDILVWDTVIQEKRTPLVIFIVTLYLLNLSPLGWVINPKRVLFSIHAWLPQMFSVSQNYTQRSGSLTAVLNF